MSRLGTEGEDIIGRWSEEKLDLLAKYLKAYSVIMKPQFDGYWFVDVSPRRIERVQGLREEFPDCVVDVRRGNCNEVLCNEIVPQLPYSSRQRAFVFLDPYGLQVDWETVRELANTRTCDIFVTFSVMGVTRLLPRDQNPEPEVVEQLSKVMGSTNWITQIYQEPPGIQLDIFGNPMESTLSRDTIQAEWLISLYAEQLRPLFLYASRPVLMRNSTNSMLYALCLASHNQTAIKITNDIFNRYEKLRDPGR